MHLMRTISMLAGSIMLAGCMGDSTPPPVMSVPTSTGACEALRPAFPVLYHSKTDSVDTQERIKVVNARFAATCP